jgi:hypothetical protein
VDGAALLAAAVRAAVQANAPRRTVQAVAAAVTGVLVRPATAVAEPHTDTWVQPDAQMHAEEAGDSAQLLASLRAVRRGQRQRKKERRRVAKLEALVVPVTTNEVVSATESVELLEALPQTVLPVLADPSAQSGGADDAELAMPDEGGGNELFPVEATVSADMSRDESIRKLPDESVPMEVAVNANGDDANRAATRVMWRFAPERMRKL